MTTTYRRLALPAALLLACIPSSKDVVGDDEGTDTGNVGGSGSMSESGDTGNSAPADGGQPVDGVIDCVTLPIDGPTVGGGELSPLGFPEAHCDPSSSSTGVYKCCSVDPAAPGGRLPGYKNKPIEGSAPPYFAGDNNALGSWGICVDTADIPVGTGLLDPAAQNCPTPCNPTWGDEEVASVCSAPRVCCQTHVLQDEDCVLDADTNLWRPVTGSDIGPTTNWSPTAHATHQDPGRLACLAMAGGDIDSAAYQDCSEQLTVADQRGVCMLLDFGQICPDAEPDYASACDLLNE